MAATLGMTMSLLLDSRSLLLLNRSSLMAGLEAKLVIAGLF